MLTTYCRALQTRPEDPVLLSNRSAAFAGLKQYKQALKDAKACVAADPSFMKGYSRQAFAYAALKQPGHAEEAYRRGLSKDPSNTGLRQMLAAFLQVCYTLSRTACLSHCSPALCSVYLITTFTTTIVILILSLLLLLLLLLLSLLLVLLLFLSFHCHHHHHYNYPCFYLLSYWPCRKMGTKVLSP